MGNTSLLQLFFLSKHDVVSTTMVYALFDQAKFLFKQDRQ